MSELTVGDSYVISREHLIEAIEHCTGESRSPAGLADAILARLQGRKIMTVDPDQLAVRW